MQFAQLEQEMHSLTLHHIILQKKEEGELNMDAVVQGLIGGGTISLLAVVVGVVAVFNESWKNTITSPAFLAVWVFVITGLQCGQLFLIWQLVTTFSEAPTQTDQAVVK